MSTQVTPGYKLTEVGVIPDDWDTSRLSDLAELTSSKRIFEHDYVPTGIPFYRGKEISLLISRKEIEDPYFISEEKFNEIKQQFGAPRVGDILITAVGTLGNIFIVKNDLKFYFKDGNLIWLRSISSSNSDYIGAQLNKHKSKILDGAIGSSQKALTIVVLRELQIPVAPLLEQRAIAEALSDMDALINGLDQLIAKKRDIKQAAMQQLLTGQQRLPGFSEEWEVKQFFDVLSRVNGKNNQIQAKNYNVYGAFPVVDQGKDYVVGYSDESDKVYSCPSDGVIVFGDHTCIIKYIDFDFIVGADGTQIIRARHGECTKFLAYKLELSGITSTGYNRHFKLLKELEFLMPTLEEQAAIATILSDMDSELANLETRRDKAQQLKQGMMQELLTGRIRLSKISQEAKLC